MRDRGGMCVCVCVSFAVRLQNWTGSVRKPVHLPRGRGEEKRARSLVRGECSGLLTWESSRVRGVTQREEQGDDADAPGPVAVLAMAAAAHGELAVALQGYSDVLLLRVEGGTQLRVTGRLTCAVPTAVSSVTYDAAGKLCVAGVSAAEEPKEAVAATATPPAVVMLPTALTEKLADAAAAGLSVRTLTAVEGDAARALHFNSTRATGMVMPLQGLVKRKHTQAERDLYKVCVCCVSVMFHNRRVRVRHRE
jgi:hypothetical protein